MSRLFAGAGKAIIEYPEEIFPFREGKDMWTGIHDNPMVRVLILEANIKIAYVSVEAVVLEAETSEKIRHAVAEAAQVPAENVWISSTHTVTTPHFFPVERKTGEVNPLGIRMNENFVKAAEEAAALAADALRPATFGADAGYCTVNVNRMIPTNEGWWIGNGEEFPSDHSVPVFRLDDESGAPIAIVYNYACELSVMDNSTMRDGGRHVTADLAGVTSAKVEEAYGHDMAALFLPGPSSDQGPVYRARRIVREHGGGYHEVDMQDDGWLLLELAAERLSEQVIVAADRIAQDKIAADKLAVADEVAANDFVPDSTAETGGSEDSSQSANSCAQSGSESSVEINAYCETYWLPGQQLKGLPNPLWAPIKEWKSAPAEDRTRSIEIMTFGSAEDGLAIVSASGLSAATAMKIKQESPFARTVVMEGVTGRAKKLPTDGAKGVADAISYELGTVQAKNSEFGPGAAEKMVENILNFLSQIG